MSDAIDTAIRDVVADAVEQALLRRAPDVVPLVYTIPAAARALCTSPDTVRRMVGDGVLPTVPHMGRRQVIPRAAVVALVESAHAEENR